MRKKIRFLISILVLPIVVSGCIISPWYDGYDGYGHEHHHGGRGGWYDGRR